MTEFRVGQRVRMTAEAIEKNIPSRWRGEVTTTGVVRGIYPDSIHLVRVQLDGRKTATRYWSGFWEPDNERTELRRQRASGAGDGSISAHHPNKENS